MNPTPTYFEMSFAPSMELVSVVRRFVGALYERLLIDSEVAHRVALAAHELLENAVKYSIDGETSIRMEVTRIGPIPECVIRTRNRTSPDNVSTLRTRLEDLKTSGDADAHYMALLRESTMPQNANRRGGLGLGRIASEAEMDLSFTVDDHGVVELSARTRGPQGAP